MRIAILFGTYVCGLVSLPCFAEIRDVPLHRDSKAHFATIEEGRELLGRRDVFISAMSRFDRQSRLGVAGDPKEEELLSFVTAQALAWDDVQVTRLSTVIDSVRKRLESFTIPFPPTVLFVQTTGREEGQAAYCRANAVVLPQRLVQQSEKDLERLVIHELFHIVSRHSPELRKTLYGIVGFVPCAAIALPGDLAARKITNPDAPLVDCFINLKIEGLTIQAAPLLLSSEKEFDPAKGGSFFRYLQFRLIRIERDADRWIPLLKDEQADLLDPKTVPDFYAKIGKNTNYIIHPDEILADNFVHLVFQTPSLATPRIVDEMRASLTR